MSSPRILVAGVGNVFFGDDGFGVEVARRLLERRWPETVTIRDFGIRGLDFAYALLGGYDAAILVDTVRRGRDPGTLYVLEVEGETWMAREAYKEMDGLRRARGRRRNVCPARDSSVSDLRWSLLSGAARRLPPNLPP